MHPSRETHARASIRNSVSKIKNTIGNEARFHHIPKPTDIINRSRGLGIYAASFTARPSHSVVSVAPLPEIWSPLGKVQPISGLWHMQCPALFTWLKKLSFPAAANGVIYTTCGTPATPSGRHLFCNVASTKVARMRSLKRDQRHTRSSQNRGIGHRTPSNAANPLTFREEKHPTLFPLFVFGKSCSYLWFHHPLDLTIGLRK